MNYRTPIVEGDRVALAPHLDLWMAGVRYGTVIGITDHEDGRRLYLVQYGLLDQTFWTTLSGLLGAVGPTASERAAAAKQEEGATPSTFDQRYEEDRLAGGSGGSDEEPR